VLSLALSSLYLFWFVSSCHIAKKVIVVLLITGKVIDLYVGERLEDLFIQLLFVHLLHHATGQFGKLKLLIFTLFLLTELIG
jgi:hypothetical protein